MIDRRGVQRAARLAAATLMIATLAACGTTTCTVGGVQMQENPATKKVVFTGPFEQRGQRCQTDGDGRRLRSEVDKANGSAIHWLDVRQDFTGGGWSYWVAARDDKTGQALTIGPAYRRTEGCSRLFGWGCDHLEQVGATIPEDLLRARSADADGLSVRFVRKAGHDTIARLSREQIKAQLDSIDAWRLGAPMH